MGCNTPLTPPTPLKMPKDPQMRIKDFNSDNSYLPSLTCNMDVRVHIGRSSGRCKPPGLTRMVQVSYKQINWQIYPPTQKHYRIYIMGCIWQPFAMACFQLLHSGYVGTIRKSFAYTIRKQSYCIVLFSIIMVCDLYFNSHILLCLCITLIFIL